jgi:autotransporter-associated beta strand protein
MFIVALVGPHAAFGQFSAAFTLTGDAQDPANVFPLTPLAITVSDTQTYGTNYWDNDISRLQLNWSNSSAGLNLATGATWTWGAPVLGLIAPPPHITINDTDLSDDLVNIQNSAGITIAPASPFSVGTLALAAPAYNPGGGNTYTLNLAGGSYDDETLTAVIDVMPVNPGDPDGVLLAPPNGTGLTLSTYTFTVVPGGQWTGGSSTAWQTPGNWSSAMAPGPTFTAVFDGPLRQNQPTLMQNEGVKGIVFKTANWAISGSGFTLTVGAGGISSSGTGTNTVDPTVNFTGAAVINVGPENTLVLAAIDVGANSLAKSGTGTLVLAGAGVCGGGTTVSEGTLLVNNASGSGTGTGTVTVGAATLGGTGIISGPVILTGDATLTSTGTLTINNTLTISDDANQLAAGTVNTSGNVTIDPGAVFIINGTLGGAGTLIVRGTLMGKGTIDKAVSIMAGGTFSPGSPSTIQGMSQILNAQAARNFSFEIGGPSPNYATPSNSLNDLVRLTSETAPFADATGATSAALTADTVIDVYFLWSDPALGEYKAQFFAATNFTDAIADATFNYWRLDPHGSRYHNGNFFSLLDESLVDWSVVPETATFGGIEVGGYITEFTVVPEPATLALLTLGGLAILSRRRMQSVRS